MTRRGFFMGVGATVAAGCSRPGAGSPAVVTEGVPSWPRADRLCFTGSGLAVLTDDALTLHDEDGVQRSRIEAARGLGLVLLGSGALIAILRDGDVMSALRVGPDGQATRQRTRVARARAPLCLLADPADEEGFWTITSDWGLAQRHTLREPDTALRVVATVPLEPGAGRDALASVDGTLQIATSEGLVSAPGGARRSAAAGAVVRLARAGGDGVWALGDDGRLALLSPSSGESLRRVTLGGRGLAMAADERGGAALTAVRDASEALSWTLHAFDAEGVVRWTATGLGEPGRSLALGGARVALGDGAPLRLWDRERGAERGG